MRDRCNNPNGTHFHNYGGRGIRVCKRWDSFICFARDMGARPKGKVLERTNNSRGYSPRNCRWATVAEQNRNKRNNIWVKVNGKRMVLSDAAKMLGVSQPMLSKRILRGMSPQAAVNAGAARIPWHGGRRNHRGQFT
jgi:hypothetical protein